MSNSPDSSEDTDASDSSTDRSTVLEQWKFYGQTTLNVSNRRLKNNRFYLRLLIALLAVVGVGKQLELVTPTGVFFAGLVGFPLCILWQFHILSYKQLNSGKYEVLNEIAQKELPYSPFNEEWEQLGRGKNPQKYIPHTKVEIWWPRVLSFPFLVMVLYGGLSIFSALRYYEPLVVSLSIGWLIYAGTVFGGYKPFQVYLKWRK